MPFDLDWGTYADWLIKVESLDPISALNRVSVIYKQQYGKPLEEAQAEQLREYLEERF